MNSYTHQVIFAGATWPPEFQAYATPLRISKVLTQQDNVQPNLESVQCRLFRHDHNFCAYAVSAIILLPLLNLSLERFSATSISYMTWKVSPFDAAFRLFWRFFTMRMFSFHHITTYSYLTSYLNLARPFSYKYAVISGARHHLWRLL